MRDQKLFSLWPVLLTVFLGIALEVLSGLAFADPMHCAGLLLSPSIAKGFTFTIMDVSYTEGDRVIELEDGRVTTNRSIELGAVA